MNIESIFPASGVKINEGLYRRGRRGETFLLTEEESAGRMKEPGSQLCGYYLMIGFLLQFTSRAAGGELTTLLSGF